MSQIDQKDLYPIIEIANQRLAEDQDRLTEEQVDAIAEELGIPRSYVDEAQEILKARRAAADRETKAAKQFKKKLLIGAVGTIAFLAFLAMVGVNGLKSKYELVEAKRAQVTNVMERRIETQRRLANEPPYNGRTAELAGAENRIHIERKRYDESAAAYNRAASTFPTSLWRAFSSLPAKVPLSNAPEFLTEVNR